MGSYIYALKSPKHVVTVTTTAGSEMEAAISTFFCRDFSFTRNMTQGERLASARLTRMANLWGGRELPLIMISTGQDGVVAAGQPVYPCSRTDYVDTPGPKLIGHVAEVQDAKVGRKTVRTLVVHFSHPELIPDRQDRLMHSTERP
jgi:hypothetical protein